MSAPVVSVGSSLESEQKLIDAVRDKHCLWDKANDLFKNTKAKESAWKEVAKFVFGMVIGVENEKDPAVLLLLVENGKKMNEFF